MVQRDEEAPHIVTLRHAAQFAAEEHHAEAEHEDELLAKHQPEAQHDEAQFYNKLLAEAKCFP